MARYCIEGDAVDSSQPIGKVVGGGGGGGGGGLGAITGPARDSPALSPAAGASAPTAGTAEGALGGNSAGELDKGSVTAGYHTGNRVFR